MPFPFVHGPEGAGADAGLQEDLAGLDLPVVAGVPLVPRPLGGRSQDSQQETFSQSQTFHTGKIKRFLVFQYCVANLISFKCISCSSTAAVQQSTRFAEVPQESLIIQQCFTFSFLPQPRQNEAAKKHILGTQTQNKTQIVVNLCRLFIILSCFQRWCRKQWFVLSMQNKTSLSSFILQFKAVPKSFLNKE